MKLERINNIKSEKFKRAVELGDNNSKTLGFLPYVAFQKYAEQNQLIGAYDENNDDLFGYLLYRISYNRVTIVHLCIDSKQRQRGITRKLFSALKEQTQQGNHRNFNNMHPPLYFPLSYFHFPNDNIHKRS